MKLGWSFLETQEIPSRTDEVGICFARCFSSTEGKKVLAYLASQTKDRFLGADATSNELWFLEGKRALFAQIENLINKGKKGE